MKKFTSSKEELLSEFVASSSWNLFLERIEQDVLFAEKKVLAYDLSQGDRGLAMEKARAEGARKLLTAIKSLKKSDPGL